MESSNNQKKILVPEVLIDKDEPNGLDKKDTEVSSFINEGNPNVQEEPVMAASKNISENSAMTSKDNQSAQVVKQAIKDDQGLAAVAKNIQVTVKDGVVTLGGTVSTEQEMNLVTNTATALGAVNAVKNQELSLKKVPVESSDLTLVEP